MNMGGINMEHKTSDTFSRLFEIKAETLISVTG